jgi:hypothetical protein
MKIKQKLLFTFSEMITAAYQVWLARQLKALVHRPEKMRPVIVRKVISL